jgi:CofH/MqnC C-terminal region
MIQTDINSAIRERAIAGEILTDAELTELDHVDVLALGMLADEARRARVGAAVTYTRVLEIGGELPPDDDRFRVRLGAAGEVRLSHLPASVQGAISLIEQTRARVGALMKITGFSLATLVERGWATASILASVKTAGLDGLVEAPIDGVDRTWLEPVTQAGLSVEMLSLQRPFESGRVSQLLRTRSLAACVPPQTSISPLPREQSVTAPTTGYHDVRLVALARLALPDVATIGVDWHQYGPKLAQVALTFGANHLDRVSLDDDAELGRRRTSLEDVRRNITSAGFEPVERKAQR